MFKVIRCTGTEEVVATCPTEEWAESVALSLEECNYYGGFRVEPEDYVLNSKDL